VENKEPYTLEKAGVDIGWLKKGFSNHLAHHERRDYMWFTAMIGLIVTLVAVIMKT